MKSVSMSHATHVGFFIVLLYLLCLAWPQIYPYSDAVQSFHLLSLQLTFPGFQGLDVRSVLWGGVLSFGYGFVGSLVFHCLHGTCGKNGS